MRVGEGVRDEIDLLECAGVRRFQKRKEVRSIHLFCVYMKLSYKCVMMALVLLCGVIRWYPFPFVLLKGHLEGC